MKWLRLRCKKFKELQFPDKCPNCFSSPANELLEITKESNLNDNTKYVLSMPFCDRCADHISKVNHSFKKLAFYPWAITAVLALIGGILIIAFGEKDDSNIFSRVGGIVLGGGLALALLLAVFGFFYAKLKVHFMPVPGGMVSNVPPVKISGFRKTFFLTGNTMNMRFLHPLYMKAFIEANPDLEFQYNREKLDSAVREFEEMRRR